MGEIKKHVLKQKVTLQYIQQWNTISVSYALNSYLLLSTLEVRKMVVRCALLPENSILHIRQWELTIHHHRSPLKLLEELLSLFQQLEWWKKS